MARSRRSRCQDLFFFGHLGPYFFNRFLYYSILNIINILMKSESSFVYIIPRGWWLQSRILYQHSYCIEIHMTTRGGGRSPSPCLLPRRLSPRLTRAPPTRPRAATAITCAVRTCRRCTTLPDSMRLPPPAPPPP